MRATPLVPLLVGFVLLGAGCSVDDGSEPEARPTTTVAAETDDEVTTTTTTLPPSVGLVEVAGQRHELTATCYAPGAGEILAVGVATNGDERIEVYLQAFLGAPYLGIAVTGDNTVVYEAAVDRPLDISYQSDVLRVDDVPLVTDLDLESGEATDGGIGSVVVECRASDW